MRRDAFPPVVVAPAALGCGVLAAWLAIFAAYAIAAFWAPWRD